MEFGTARLRLVPGGMIFANGFQNSDLLSLSMLA
jgi:hypothetical protein